MIHLSQLFSITSQSLRQILVPCNTNNLVKVCVRYATHKSTTCSKNKPGHPKPKHRGWKVFDGEFVPAGKMLATQLKTRFHPGLNVGFGRNGTLFAMCPGKVLITCEKINPNFEHTWIQKNYGGRENQDIYKKHFNVIPEPQHNRFKLIEIV